MSNIMLTFAIYKNDSKGKTLEYNVLWDCFLFVNRFKNKATNLNDF